MNYVYFGEGTAAGTGTAQAYPAANFMGIDSASATTAKLYFKPVVNLAAYWLATASRAPGCLLREALAIANFAALLFTPRPEASTINFVTGALKVPKAAPRLVGKVSAPPEM